MWEKKKERIPYVAGIEQGTPKFLGQLGNGVIQCVDFCSTLFFFLEGEVIRMWGETAELSYFLLSTTWLLPPFIKKFLVYFLGNIDFAVNYNYREQKQEWWLTYEKISFRESKFPTSERKHFDHCWGEWRGSS